MSLQVWLPFTDGTLKQQGLSNVTVISSNYTVNNSGKLGKCIKTKNATGLDLGYNGNQINTGSISFGGWFKFNKDEIGEVVNNARTYDSTYNTPTGQLIGNDSYGGIGIVWNSNNMYTSSPFSNLLICSNIRTSTVNRTTSSYTVVFDTWVHIFVTFNKDTGALTLYINGSKFSETIFSSFSDARSYNLILNYAGVYGGNGPGLYIPFACNDVRIYDNCLSVEEVKRISQGLVLHYPLNRMGFGQDNLLKNSNFLQGTNGMQGYTATSATCTKQTDCMKVVSTSASGGFYSSNFDSITTGDMTIFSADVKADSSMTIYIGTDGSGNGSCQAYTVGNTWQRISISKAKTTNNANLRIYGNGTFYVKNLKYELGSIATPWCPNSSDALATTMGLNSTTEYDTSGYCNNGTWQGTHTNTSDTPKYAVSTTATGDASTYLEGPILPADAQTAALWIKCKKSQNAAIFNDKTSGLQIGLLNSLLYMNSKASTAGFTTTHWEDDNWNHVVVTYDGTTRKAYINGEAETQSGASNYYIHNADNCWLWNRSYNNNYPFNGSLSDFRIYATALSADDVKSLYQNCATIDSNGTIYGQIRT